MISELRFNNFRLFKNDSVISFVPDARTKTLMSNSSILDNRRSLKSLAIYGSNNGGKSNLIAMIEMLKSILLGRADFECNRQIFQDEPISSFSITYNNDDELGWIRYSFSYDSENRRFINEEMESIKYYANGAPFKKMIFKKDSVKKIFIIGCDDHSEIMDFIPSSLPILYSLELRGDKFSSLSQWLSSLQRLASSIEVVRMFNIPISKTIEDLKSKDERKKKFISSFVKDADISINDFKYSKDVHILKNGEEVEEKALSGLEEQIDALRLSTTYGKTNVPSIIFDSSGTKKIEALASYVYDAITNGKTLFIDELDNGLHFRLTRAIVSAFNNLVNKKGQLVFTAHDLMLIDCKMLLRKDQIYFVERNKDFSSRIYSLGSITVASGGPREGSDLLKRYNKGEITPLPTPSFVNELLELNREEADSI